MNLWVLDASRSENGLLCYSPFIDGKYKFGLTLFAELPPKGSNVHSIIHPFGQKFVDDWCDIHKEIVNKIIKFNESKL